MNQAMGVHELDGLEALIDAVNVALEAGDWPQVVMLTVELYTVALEVGETCLAELVQDLHWIASDAVEHPLQVAEVLAP
jgi:hypothetical protein